MKSRAFLPVLLPAAVSALVVWEAAKLPLNGAITPTVAQPAACTNPLHFNVAFPQSGLPVQQISPDQSYAFMGNGWLDADTCRGGTLYLTGEGQVAGGTAPTLQVALDSKVIWTGKFTALTIVRVPIPSAGHLTVGYFNDFYSSDYRNAFLENLRFQSDSCQTFGVNVPVEAGGSWNAQTRSLGWLFATPVELQPCTAGLLTFNASGREGGRSFATLSFKQSGKEIKQVRLNSQPQEVAISITAKPLEIRIVNPYFKELGDRNLTLQKIQFLPSQ